MIIKVLNNIRPKPLLNFESVITTKFLIEGFIFGRKINLTRGFNKKKDENNPGQPRVV